jgi:hypothetical protein
VINTSLNAPPKKSFGPHLLAVDEGRKGLGAVNKKIGAQTRRDAGVISHKSADRPVEQGCTNEARRPFLQSAKML